MDKLKAIKVKQPDGQFGDAIPIGADAANIDMSTGKNLQETMGEVDVDADGNVKEQLDKLNKNKVDISDFNYYKNYVTPQMYGAVGDGITDDTKAIQECFNKNTSGAILFKQGTYIISEQLEIPQDNGGVVLLLNGSIIKASLSAVASADKAIFHFKTGKNFVGRFGVIGGTILCEDKFGIGIHCDTFHGYIDKVKIYDMTNIGIKIGTSNNGRSLQCVVNDVLISIRQASSQQWSDNNNVIGIGIYEPDNMFSNINTNRCKIGMYFESQGNHVVNAHFTTQYRNQLVEIADSYGIVNYPLSPYTINVNNLTNIYFDNCKYCIYNPKSSRVQYILNNCKYFNSGNQTSGIINTGLIGGYPLQIDSSNFGVISVNSNCRFLPSTVSTIPNYNISINNKEQYSHNMFSLSEQANVIYLANHFVENGEYLSIIRGEEIPAKSLFEIGCVIHYNDTYSGCVTFNLSFAKYGECSLKINFGQYGVSLLEQKCLVNFNCDFLIKSVELIDINGINFYCHKLYIRPGIDWFNTRGQIMCFSPKGLNIFINNEKSTQSILEGDYEESDYKIYSLNKVTNISNEELSK